MLKEIIKTTLMLLGRDEALEEVETKSVQDFSPTTSKLVSSLIKISNLVLSDVTREIACLSAEEILKTDDSCTVAYSAFSNKVIGIKSALLGGRPATFNLYPEYVKLGKPNQEYTFAYNFENKKATSLDDKIILPLGVTVPAIAYGVAREYCSIHLLYDECNMWEQKFVRAMEYVRSKCGERKVYRWWSA